MWADRITRAEDVVKAHLEEYDELIQFYRGDIPEEIVESRGMHIYVNYHFAYARTILPTIYFQNPEPAVTPRGQAMFMPPGMAHEFAKIREELLSYQIDELGLEWEMRKVIFDGLFFKWGVMKMGFAPALRRKEKPFDPTEIDLLEDIMYEGLLEDEEQGPNDDPHQKVTDTNPFALRVAPWHFLIDPLASSLDDARWVAHCILRPLDDVQSNPKYNAAVAAGIQGTRNRRDERSLNQVNPRSGSLASTWNHPNVGEDLIMLYEIWDIQNREYLILDDYSKMHTKKSDFLVKKPWPYMGIDGFPFRTLVFNPDPEYPEGISDASVWHGPALAQNLVSSMRFNHIKRFNRKYETFKSNLNQEEMNKLESPIDGAIIVTNSQPGVPSILPIHDAPMSPDIYAFQDQMRRDNELTTGINESRKGGSSKGTKTATEASIVESTSRVRDSDRIYIVTKFFESVIRVLDQLNQSFLSSEYVAFVTRPSALQLWQQQSAEILRMEALVSVRVGSSAYVSKEVRTKQLLDFLNITTKAVDPMSGMPIVDARKVIMRLAEYMDIPGVEDLILPMVPPPPPGMMPPPMPGQGSAPSNGGGVPRSQTRDAGTSMGSQLSGIQNVGARPNAPPMAGRGGNR